MPPEKPSPEARPGRESERTISDIKQELEAAKENENFEKAMELRDERDDKLESAQEEATQVNDRVDEIDEQINKKEAQKEEAKESDELEEALRLQNEIEDLEKEKEQLVNGSAETVANENTQESTPGPPESQESPADVEKNEESQESLSNNEGEPIETEEERQKKINNVKEELGMEVEEQPSSGSQESPQPGTNTEVSGAGTIGGDAESSPETATSFDELMSDYETLQNEAELDRREFRGKMRYALSAGNLEQFKEAFSQKLENDIQELERKIEILENVRESNNGTEFYGMDEEAENRAQDHLKSDIENLKDKKESKQDQLNKLESGPEMQAKLAEQRMEIERDRNAEIEVNRLLGDMRDMQESHSDWIENGGAYDPKSAYELVGMANAANEHGNERGNELLREAKSVIEEAEQNANGPIDRVRT